MVAPLTAAQASPIYHLKVVLLGSDPKVWRRFCVPSMIRLSQLHKVLQGVMGWTDYHLHAFRLGEETYQVPMPDFDEGLDDRRHDERKFSLADLLQRPKQGLLYEYDFGDGWEHDLILEKVSPADPEAKHALCLAGANACPPEDCGGLPGYDHLLGVLADPRHEEHSHLREWIGGSFDPKAFDIARVNRFLKKIKI